MTSREGWDYMGQISRKIFQIFSLQLQREFDFLELFLQLLVAFLFKVCTFAVWEFMATNKKNYNEFREIKKII